MTQEKIARINELAKKSKTTGLTEAEKAEQQALRCQGRYTDTGYNKRASCRYGVHCCKYRIFQRSVSLLRLYDAVRKSSRKDKTELPFCRPDFWHT